MSTMQNETMIDRIRKLLTTAADQGATPNEAAVALRLAQRLMTKHRISDGDIAAAKAAGRNVGSVSADAMASDIIGPYVRRQDGWLAQAVGLVCGAGVFINGKTVVAYGLPADIAATRELFAFIRSRAMADRREWCRQRGMSPASVAGLSFIDGYACALLQRCRDEHQRSLESTDNVEIGTMAMVAAEGSLVQQLDGALEAKKASLGLRKRRARATGIDATAFASGQAASRLVALSRNRPGILPS